MMSVEEVVLEKLRVLPFNQQQEVLYFIEFLLFRVQQLSSNPAPQGEVSFLDATREFVGCLEGGPSDLSVNSAYLEELGHE